MNPVALRRAAVRPVDAASAAVFRIGVGLVGVVLAWRFFANGWVDSLFVDPAFHFKYPGFAWVRVWPGWGMHAHVALIGLASVGLLVGWRSRLCAAVVAVLVAYLELIDRSLYLNHYYWLILTAGLLALLPVDRAFTLGRKRERSSSLIPSWVVWLLRFQVGMVYFFAGLAKLNGDWLVRGEPLATWLPARSELWLIGPLFALPATAVVMAWLGAFFDLTVVGWLSFERTRPYAFGALVGFHTLTWLLFPSIGLFPVLMMIAALIFFPPDWPRRFVPVKANETNEPGFKLQAGKVAVAALYVAAMVALPLRHLLVPGDVKWTGEGYLGSWQVMLTEKSGSATFLVTDPGTGRTWRVPPPDVLNERQRAVMATDPTMIMQAADLIAADLGDVEVFADVVLSFNGRPSVQYTDPAVELTRLPDDFPSRDWLMPEPA